MADPANKPRTFKELYAEIERLPENLTGEILEEGVVRTMSRPAKRHRRAAGGVLESLSGVNENYRGKGWWIEVEAEIALPVDRLAVPDLSGWRVERVSNLPDENPLTVIPDWCCEVLSPSTARSDKGLKLPLYTRANVPWIWIVDPILRFVEIFQTVNGRPMLELTAEDDEQRVLPPFDHEISLASWWLPDAVSAEER